MPRLSILALVLSSFLLLIPLQSCRHGPSAVTVELPSRAIEEAMIASNDPIVFENAESIQENWWALFEDAQLSNFIETAFERNPNLQAARANILLAAANADRLRANLYPNLLLAADVSRQKLSETGLIPFTGNQPPGTTGVAPIVAPATGGVNGIPVYFTQYETEFNLTYDFDLWGKNRNTWQAAINQVQADIADEAFKKLQLGISVTQVYFELQVDYKREENAKAIVENRAEYLELVKKRIQANLDSSLNFQDAENKLSIAKQTLLQIQGSIAVEEYQLKAYLAGNFEEEIFSTEITGRPLPRVPLPCNLPLNLIAHRPDIMSQLWVIESAGKQIDVARAGFYPDFNLAAVAGFQTLHLHKLFEGKSGYFNVDPAVSLPIFEGGRLVANLQASEINYDLAILEYNNLVLNAARDVLDGIAVLRNTVQQLNEFKKQTNYEEKLLQLTNQRISGNLNSRIDYFDRYENVLLARDRQMLAMKNSIQAILSLIKALGGGYEACYEEG